MSPIDSHIRLSKIHARDFPSLMAHVWATLSLVARIEVISDRGHQEGTGRVASFDIR